MSSIINGSAAVTEQPKRYGWTGSRGEYSIRKWRGPKSAVAAMVAQIASLGSDWEVDEEVGPFATITYTAQTLGSSGGGGTTEQPVNTWTLGPNYVEKDILASDQTAIKNLSANHKQLLKKTWQEKTDETVPDSITSATDPNVPRIYKLMLRGLTSVKVLQPILKHTATVSSEYTNLAGLVNIANTGKVLRAATLFSNNPSIPNSLRAITPNFDSISPETIDGNVYYWGWLQNYPTFEAIANGKMQINQDWEFGMWAGLIYGASV